MRSRDTQIRGGIRSCIDRVKAALAVAQKDNRHVVGRGFTKCGTFEAGPIEFEAIEGDWVSLQDTSTPQVIVDPDASVELEAAPSDGRGCARPMGWGVSNNRGGD